MSVDDQKYREFVRKIQFRELEMSSQSVNSIKFQEFKVEARKRLIQAKSGFYFGFVAGGTLGLILGLPTAIKHRQVSVLLMSGLASGLFFSAISGIGTIIRQEDVEAARAHRVYRGFVASDF